MIESALVTRARRIKVGLAPSVPSVPSSGEIKAIGPQASTAAINLPNAISMIGYGATIGWLAGGPWPLAFVGIAADELDGYAARATGDATPYGSLLDWAIDLTLTGLVLVKLGCPWALLVVTPVQVYLREIGWAPRFGSARAAFTMLALARGGR